MGLKLIASDIHKNYNGTPALSGCSYSFDSGRTYAIMGHNGSGKSTFLRICALLEEPDKGKITYSIDGTVLKKDIWLKRKITLVLPKVGIFNTTVFNNAAYGLKLRGLNRKKIEEETYMALDFVGLIHKKNHNALTLSSGEAQRLGIARAIVISPEMIFLDEPTASVDIKNTEIIEGIIMKMRSQKGTTIVISTHDILQAKRLVEQILVIKEGQIEEKLPAD